MIVVSAIIIPRPPDKHSSGVRLKCRLIPGTGTSKKHSHSRLYILGITIGRAANLKRRYRVMLPVNKKRSACAVVKRPDLEFEILRSTPLASGS